MARIRVLVVDDHAVLREGVCALLARKQDIAVVGQAGSGDEALALVETTRPNVVLMDISMPGMNGLEATRQIKARFPDTQILVLTQHEDTEYVLPLLEAGAAGYILKRAGGGELVSAIRSVFNDRAFLEPSVARTVIAQVGKGENSSERRLTEREKQILILIAQGSTGPQIAEKLGLSEKTVAAHRSNIMEKLDIHHTADLVRYAIRQGWVTA